jgi:hypothetical protein
MTFDELIARESIRDTMARYTMAGDRLRADEFAAAFTEDGVLESEFVPPEDAFRYAGREELRGWFQRWVQPTNAEKTVQASFIRHHLATSLIELTGPDSATARTYWTAYTDIGADHCGYYLDVFRKVGEQWLIAHRRVRLDWRHPEGLFQTAIENSR